MMSIFNPLEVVGRGSGSQLQVDEKLNVIHYIFPERLIKGLS